MNTDALKIRLRSYAASFSGESRRIDREVRRKLVHTFFVTREMERLAASLALEPQLHQAALAVALLHDYSRFEQIRQFGTYFDAVSTDHGVWSSDLVQQHRLLDDWETALRGDVLAAIANHNQLAPNPALGPRALTLTQMIRDVDKLDIMRVELGFFHEPESRNIVYELEHTQELTPAVGAALRSGRSPRNGDLRTVIDFFGAKFAWVYDLNFAWTCGEFETRRCFEILWRELGEPAVLRDVYENACGELRRRRCAAR